MRSSCWNVGSLLLRRTELDFSRFDLGQIQAPFVHLVLEIRFWVRPILEFNHFSRDLGNVCRANLSSLRVVGVMNVICHGSQNYLDEARCDSAGWRKHSNCLTSVVHLSETYQPPHSNGNFLQMHVKFGF